MKISDIPAVTLERFRRGTVIPAQPLALDENREFDKAHQRALTRYYIDAGVGGIAVGVHSTQFEIRLPEHDLFKSVLALGSETIDKYQDPENPILKVAGICGKTEQAVAEAEYVQGCGYHAGLLSLAALKDDSITDMIAHCRAVADVMPIIGFYLQPSVGGCKLTFDFWREFAEIENVLGIKMAPFNQYATFDVVRAVCEAGRNDEITLYTGNDDHIVIDLLTEYCIRTSRGEDVKVRIRGGLLGHWCVWTKKAVELLDEIHAVIESGGDIPAELLTRQVEVTDANAALFDPAHDFAGCIPGIHEVLRRQGLLQGTWCLNPDEVLSPGQSEELDRIYRSYPHLNDDQFVADNLGKWLEE